MEKVMKNLQVVEIEAVAGGAWCYCSRSSQWDMASASIQSKDACAKECCNKREAPKYKWDDYVYSC